MEQSLKEEGEDRKLNVGSLISDQLRDLIDRVGQEDIELAHKLAIFNMDYERSFKNLHKTAKILSPLSEKLLLEALEIEPNHMPLLLDLATYYSEKKAFKEANVYFEKLMNIDLQANFA